MQSVSSSQILDGTVQQQPPRAVAEPRRVRRTYLLMLLPGLAFLAVIFVYPLVDVIGKSVVGAHGLTLENYRHIWQHPVYLHVLAITFEIAAIVTALTLLAAYPVAYVLATAGSRTRTLVMGLILVPFFTSILVRTYAWLIVLGSHGFLHEVLSALGLRSPTLLYNRAGVVIGMTYALLPYMVLTLYGNMRAIDTSLVRAAHNLGASDWQAFRRVFFPLSLPGVAGGSLLVFILGLGYFVTPRLMGGSHDQMIATVIDQQVELANNNGFAAALAAILFAVTLVGFFIYNRTVGLQSLFQGGTR